VRTVVQTHTQIRSVFSDPQVLQPLELEDVQKLLANRYAALQLGPEQPWRAPVMHWEGRPPRQFLTPCGSAWRPTIGPTC
jgi:hypothetical protein